MEPFSNHVILRIHIVGIILAFSGRCVASNPDLKIRHRRFGGPMGGGGGGPFHHGGMSGPMSGPMGGAMGGAMGGMMMGPHAPSMGPAGGGPNGGGQGSSAFGGTTATGFKCVRRNIVCPKWCMVEDENGCQSCPCGPAGGMSAMAGGPSGGPMGGMPGGGVGGHTSGGYSGGSSATVHSTTTTTGGGSNTRPASVSGSYTNTVTTGSGHSGGGTTNYIIIGGGATKPVHECKATLLCASTCSNYQLGATSSNGCKSCTCPTSHHVSTTTVHYIVRPAAKECTSTASCMSTCHSGYTMSTTDGHGCPQCTCLQVRQPYKPPIEIAVEPPPYTDTVPSVALSCSVRPCAAGCTVGYKCGVDGCPTCECIHPSVVGTTSVQQVYIARPPACTTRLSCRASCSLGYKCGIDGCPSCTCLVPTATRPQYTVQTVQTRPQPQPQYVVQTCSHTLTCAATCGNGYEMVKDGTGGCGKCVCRIQQVTYERRPVYAVQRPQPQYQIVTCHTETTCATRCSHGYELVSGGSGACPECRCKPAPIYTYTSTSTGCQTGCETGGRVVYLTGGSSLQRSSGGNLNNLLSGSAVSPSSGYLFKSANAGTSDWSAAGQAGYQAADSLFCPPLPPDCNPSCIKYDQRCRTCECETSVFRYGKK